ncbi:DUF3226 domain-containing protein [Chondromyces apiculatus]|uniref:DUF4276 family protein n=1 Tax=Chondromyces apiculatus DSM 436 TaxID=1192034 RepID=A0A017TGM6_9BACT|nr:DUF3226 domain-containing protein [Chondromyces apiculatus]EYF07761.1 Hypothetical protein CAP_7710 [Chondromyces apiculatus DSM 436]
MNIASLFEDEDDLHLFGQLARRLGLPELKDKPTSLKGYDRPKLKKKLGNVVKTDWERIVLVLDADCAPSGGPERRWKEVLDAFRAAEIEIPGDASTEDGLIHDLADGRRVAVWLFPDCRSEGAIEDFVLQRLVPDGDALLGHAETVVDALPSRLFPLKYIQKARMRSWLAWQKRPGLPPGHAVSENVLTVSETRLGSFAPWLRRAIG